MSVQDNVERILREFHILISKGEPYENSSDQVIVSKEKALELLNQLAYSMSDMLEEYEATARSRDKKERDAKRRREEILRNANHAAEDVYAASVLYSDEALGRIQNIMQDANDEMEKLFSVVRKEMRQRQQIVRENQLELKSTLEDLKDTDKYRKIIEERNKEMQKKKDKKPAQTKAFPAGKPEIKVNPEYFEKIGRPVEVPKEELAEEPGPKALQEMEIKVNLDAEYFRWKQQQKKQEDEVKAVRKAKSE